MHEATTRGVFIIQERTDNTCFWTWALQADLKIKAMPARLMDIVTKQQLMWANELQEKFRRNGKEVDGERVDALVEVMEKRRGVSLMEDQAEVFERCSELLEEVRCSEDKAKTTRSEATTKKARYEVSPFRR